MTPRSPRRRRAPIAALAAVLAVATTMLSPASAATSTPARIAPQRIGDSADVATAAVDISTKTWSPGSARIVVLGRDDVFADSLAGAALAGTSGPVLFTTGGGAATLLPSVRAEIERVLPAPAGCGNANAGVIDVLGGTAAIAPAVVDELAAAGYCVRRIAGTDRIETAALVGNESADTTTVLLARSDTWPDSAAASAYAAATGHPILVTPPTSLAPAVKTFLANAKPNAIVLLGGTGALSDAVESQARAYGTTRRVAGATRDATAVAIATSLPRTPAPLGVSFVDGWATTGWAYAIAGAVHAALEGTVELLVQPTTLTQPDVAHLSATDDTFTVVVGPSSLVSNDIISMVETSRDWQRIAIPGDAPQRYRDDIATSATKTSDVTYRTATNRSGASVTLKLDVYEPAGDTVTSRPVIIWVHGGGFSSGNKTSPEIVDEATTFAKKGFVTISIDYRLEPEGCSAAAPTGACIDAIKEAMDDAQAAVRWVRANADTYDIDTTRIAIGGSSAGAITALNVGYQSSEDAASAVHAVLSLSGANLLGHISHADPPALLLHGTSDATVPYAWAGNTVRDARAAGDLTVLTSWPGAGHVPYGQFRDQILREQSQFLWWMLELGIAGH
jgi:acetyl esterase/lipase/putative cell wall-binding protein